MSTYEAQSIAKTKCKRVDAALLRARRWSRSNITCSCLQRARLCQPPQHPEVVTGSGVKGTGACWGSRNGDAEVIYKGSDDPQLACSSPLTLMKFRWLFFSQEVP